MAGVVIGKEEGVAGAMPEKEGGGGSCAGGQWRQIARIVGFHC